MSGIRMVPMFSIENYTVWRVRMEAHLTSLHDSMTDVLESGPIIPMIDSVEFAAVGGVGAQTGAKILLEYKQEP